MSIRFLFACFCDINSACCLETHENHVIYVVVASFGYQIQGLLLTALKQNCFISFIHGELAHFKTFVILKVYLQDLW